MAIKKKRVSKPKTKRASKKSKRMTKRTSRKPIVRKPVVRKPPPPPATGPVDFDDEDAVLAEVATAIDVPVDQLSIREMSAPAGVGNSKSYQIEITGGTKEWFVVENDEAAEELALAAVTQDLENEPEIFMQSFIESHIDTEKLRRELHSDVLNMREEDLREMSAKDFWREAEGHGVSPKYTATGNDPAGKDHNIGEFDDEDDAEEAGRKWVEDHKAAETDPEDADSYDFDVEAADPSDSDIETVAEAQTNDQLKDPMQYLEDIYGKEDVVKQAIQIAGIDVNAAAQEAVSSDGPGHFLSSYDGELHETKRGLVYWRHN